jgi:flavin reductase (DIM6/NTAB) family NADH-FMN oxidoreductase RutF
MHIDLQELTPTQTYFTMIQTLIPRPIAWVLSENADGGLNLAPFSYFTAVSSSPPLIMISTGRKPDGGPKDTRVNVEQREDFVVMIPHRELMEAMNESSMSLPAGESEVSKLGLKTTPLEGSRLPRLADCRVAYACRRFEILEMGNAPQALLFGQVDAIYVDDAIVDTDAKGRQKIRADRLDPVCRLGAGEYGLLGELRQLARPD